MDKMQADLDRLKLQDTQLLRLHARAQSQNLHPNDTPIFIKVEDDTRYDFL